MTKLAVLELSIPLLGIERPSQDQRKPNFTNPNLLEEHRIILVSTEVLSLESSGAEDSLEQLFESASQVALIVITSEDMERDKKELKDLVAQAEAKMDVNPVEFMQVERMC